MTRSSEYENPIFHYYFLNKDISVTKQRKIMKFSKVAHHIPFEGSVSQILYLGPSFYFMLCRKKYLKNIPKVTRFLI